MTRRVVSVLLIGAAVVCLLAAILSAVYGDWSQAGPPLYLAAVAVAVWWVAVRR